MTDFDPANYFFTGAVRECESATAICLLCYQPGLRWQFEIESRKTGQKLYVGSTCILRFGITVLDRNGHMAHGDHRRTILNRSKRQTRHRKLARNTGVTL